MSGATYEAARENGEKAPEEFLNAQRNFFEYYLGRFSGKIATESDKKAKSLYYKGISRLAWGFVESDTLFLDAFLDKKDGKGGLADER